MQALLSLVFIATGKPVGMGYVATMAAYRYDEPMPATKKARGILDFI